MSLKVSTNTLQKELANYCRAEQPQPIKGLNPQRLQHYRRLIRNIIHENVSKAYPLAKELLSEEWSSLIDLFFENYACTEPQVWRMPKDFFLFVQQMEEENSLKSNHPYLTELLYFEWIELELYMMEDQTPLPHSEEGDWENSSIVLNPEARLLKFNYPVHTTTPGQLKNTTKGQFFCLIYREPKEYKVKFMDLSPLPAFIIEQLMAEVKLVDVFHFLEREQHIRKDQLLSHTLPLLHHLRKDGFILGFR